ncbi:MAG: cupin domain-containing protein [Deltaproteobacteria bacterium]|nr:cupin domain-containing protein [Deltaproteobacteria bacterium]
MISRSKNILCILSVVAAVTLTGCSYHKRHIYSLGEEGLYSKEWRQIIKEYPIGKKDNIRVTPLFKNEDSSHYIIQINGRERPHIHEEHDLTVIVKKGKGTLHLGEEKLSMKAGDIAFIPRGTVHYFVNEKKHCPAVSYVIFSPSYHGKDKKMVNEVEQ